MNKGYWLSIAGALSLLTSVTCVRQKVLGGAGNEDHASPNSIELLPPRNPAQPTELEQAYLDSFSILKDKSPCSEFYGGSSAIAALNHLTQEIRPKRMDRRIGIKMTCEATIVTSALTGLTI